MIIFIVPKNSGLSICKEVSKEYIGDILEVRGEDVPRVVWELSKLEKKAIGITGEDLFKDFLICNKEARLSLLKRITWDNNQCMFDKPTLSLIGPKNKDMNELPRTIKIGINRKYANLAEDYLKDLGEKYRLEKIYLSGATEQLISLGVCDLVVDIVCSGKTLSQFDLSVYKQLFSSDIVVIGGEK